MYRLLLLQHVLLLWLWCTWSCTCVLRFGLFPERHIPPGIASLCNTATAAGIQQMLIYLVYIPYKYQNFQYWSYCRIRGAKRQQPRLYVPRNRGSLRTRRHDSHCNRVCRHLGFGDSFIRAPSRSPSLFSLHMYSRIHPRVPDR